MSLSFESSFFAFVASTLAAVAAFYLTLTVCNVVAASRKFYEKYAAAPPTFREELLNRVRETDAFFRGAEAFVREIAPRFEKSPLAARVEYCLQLKGGDFAAWPGDFYLASKLLEAFAYVGVPAALIGAYYFRESPLGGVVGLIVGVFASLLVFQLTTESMKTEARANKEAIKRRLPYVVDLMALARNAGASFGESLRIVAEENKDTLAGEVFQKTYQDFTFGASQRQTLDNLAARMQDPDFDELVFSINESEKKGVPIVQALAELARQMRLKRRQWGEKAAGEAEVKILFPGLIIMLACMLTIVAPFVLLALNDGLNW